MAKEKLPLEIRSRIEELGRDPKYTIENIQESIEKSFNRKVSGASISRWRIKFGQRRAYKRKFFLKPELPLSGSNGHINIWLSEIQLRQLTKRGMTKKLQDGKNYIIRQKPPDLRDLQKRLTILEKENAELKRRKS